LTTSEALPGGKPLLVLVPLSALFVGGLIGGVIGALGAIGNLRIARTSLPAAAKVAVMLGVGVVCYIVLFIVAGVLYAMTHK
jgi:hypothetical protein